MEQEETLPEGKRDQYIELLSKWNQRCRRAINAYNRATERSTVVNMWLGVPATVLSAAVATAVFSSLSQDPAVGWKIATGGVAALASLLAALQTFLRLDERIELYRESARKYAHLRRRIELATVAFPDDPQKATALVDSIRVEIDAAAVGNINAPGRLWIEADRKLGSAEAQTSSQSQ